MSIGYDAIDVEISKQDPAHAAVLAFTVSTVLLYLLCMCVRIALAFCALSEEVRG